MKTIIDPKFAAINDAVCYWLGYQFKIGRDQLIHEASLRYPIADTITSLGIAINRIVLELLHPLFKSKKIDLVIFQDDVKNPANEADDKNLKEVYEFKLAKFGTSVLNGDEHQRVFDDVIRLAYYNLWSKKECYFLMCGKYEDFKAFFIGHKNPSSKLGGSTIVTAPQSIQDIPGMSSWNATGLYKDWFGFRIGEEKDYEFSITDPTNQIEWGLGSFQHNYHIREHLTHSYARSIKIKTRCVAITPNGLTDKTHAVGIWKIESKN
ncbi:MAG: hypothetical protein WCK34_16815 [Bacteroidota bacterium]